MARSQAKCQHKLRMKAYVVRKGFKIVEKGFRWECTKCPHYTKFGGN